VREGLLVSVTLLLLGGSASQLDAVPTSAKSHLSLRQGVQDEPLAARQLRALDSEGLHAAAKITGSYVSKDRAPGGLVKDLPTLARNVSTIIIGVVRDGSVHLSGNGRAVVTEYPVIVESSIKGGLTAGQQIMVDLRGGRITFADGTWAETTPWNFKFDHPKPGDRAVFFLGALSTPEKPHEIRKDAGGKEVEVLSVVLSYYVFILRDSVHPAMDLPVPSGVFASVGGKPVDWFLAQVREAVK